MVTRPGSRGAVAQMTASVRVGSVDGGRSFSTARFELPEQAASPSRPDSASPGQRRGSPMVRKGSKFRDSLRGYEISVRCDTGTCDNAQQIAGRAPHSGGWAIHHLFTLAECAVDCRKPHNHSFTGALSFSGREVL